MTPTPDECAARSRVVAALLEAIATGTTVKLPDFDRSLSAPGQTALHRVGIEPNPFGATLGPFRYQFEGEEDLLHLIVARLDGAELSHEEGRSVAAFVLDGVAPGFVWAKPGTVTQHFYLGHDVLVGAVRP